MKMIGRILSEDTILNISLYSSIFSTACFIALTFIIYTSYSEIKNSFPMEGNIESISRSKLTIKGIEKPIKLVCNCKFLNHQPDKYRYAIVLAAPIENQYKATALTLDGRLIIDEKSNLKMLVVIWIFMALLALFFGAILRSAFKSEKSIPDPNYDLDQLFDEIKSKTEALKKPSLRLLKTSKQTVSHFGGKPLVQEGFIWPESNNKPMTFLAQIDLSEMSAEFQFDWLPSKGLLLFFYDTFEMHWGFDPEHKNYWKVIYQAHPEHIVEPSENINKKFCLKERYIHPKIINLLPNLDEIDLEEMGFSEDEIDAYIEISSESDDAPHHQVGGFSSPIQNGMMHLQAQLVSNGINLGGEVIYTEETAKIEEGADDWKLLFQFDSDDDVGSMWCDAGRLYFWVQASKSINGNFDDCWVFLQSH